MLLLAPGVLAVGVGERTTPAGAERLARQVFAAGLAHTVLVVPIAQERATMHLDTVCTMVDVDAVVMYPNIADTLTAYTVIAGADGETRGSTGRRRSCGAAAEAMGIDRLRVIDTGLDPVTAEREQWDDGNNTLALAPRLCVALRAQRRDQRPAGAGRHRGDPRSPAPSWAPAGAARAACPARSPATRWPASRLAERLRPAGVERLSAG